MNLLEQYPFISIIYNKKNNFQYPIIIDLVSKHYISYYNLNNLSKELRHKLLDLAVIWYRKNIQIPLSLYYRDNAKEFSKSLEYLENNEYEIINGSKGTNLKNLSEKRIKRKMIKVE